MLMANKVLLSAQKQIPVITVSVTIGKSDFVNADLNCLFWVGSSLSCDSHFHLCVFV